ncbi:MAG: TIGR03790 family protein [Synechococcaceae cyanobacterium]|nr:TIGR03790 family protein [Synechococcaceae cyanobacterium]
MSGRAGAALEDAGPLGPTHLAVVINADDPLSEAIGTLYQRSRGIPAAHLIRVRFPPGSASLDPERFQALRREILVRTPERVELYALAWAAPWLVGCQSITSALSFGVRLPPCPDSCRTTPLNPYFARGDVRRPWQQLRLRPSMLLAATSLEQADSLFRRSGRADGSAPPGTAYLMSTSDGARNVRARRFKATAASLAPGFNVRILQGDTLRHARDVMAYFTGLARVEGISSNRFRPGAVADHLTSFGGRLTEQGGQTSALRWLEAGASGSYGTVVEPCAFAEKFPDPALLLGYYVRGDTLIESYWRSVAMPAQGVFIGDPLTRPWPARRPD